MKNLREFASRGKGSDGPPPIKAKRGRSRALNRPEKGRQTEDTESTDRKRVVIRISQSLWETLQKMCATNRLGGVWDLASISDIVRGALQASLNKEINMLSESAFEASEAVKGVTVLMEEDLFAHYSSFPKRYKREIMERLLRVYLRN